MSRNLCPLLLVGDLWRTAGWRCQSAVESWPCLNSPWPTWPDPLQSPNPLYSPATSQSTGWKSGGSCHRSMSAGFGFVVWRSGQTGLKVGLCPECPQPRQTGRPAEGPWCKSEIPQWRTRFSDRSLRSGPPAAEGRRKPKILTGSGKCRSRFPCGTSCSCRCCRGWSGAREVRCAGEVVEGCQPKIASEKYSRVSPSMSSLDMLGRGQQQYLMNNILKHRFTRKITGAFWLFCSGSEFRKNVSPGRRHCPNYFLLSTES